MKVINNGKHITIKASFYEAAVITEAIRRGAMQYEQESLSEFAEEARQIVEELTNRAEVSRC